MKRSRVGMLLALLILVGVGAYLVVLYFNKSPGTTNIFNPRPAETRKAAAEVPAVRFVDVTDKSGVRFHHFNAATPQKLLPETMGGGVAILDYDGDGKPD